MPMELVHAFLAGFADLDSDGKFSVLGGGFDGIVVPAFPASVATLAIIVRIRIPHEEAGCFHEIRVIMYDPDEGPIYRSNPTNLSPIQPPGPRIGPFEHGSISNIVVRIFNLILPVYGLYRVDFLEGERVFGNLAIPIADSAALRGA